MRVTDYENERAWDQLKEGKALEKAGKSADPRYRRQLGLLERRKSCFRVCQPLEGSTWGLEKLPPVPRGS